MRLPKIVRDFGKMGRSSLVLLISLTLGHVVVHWYQVMFSLIIPSVKSDLSLSSVQVGTMSTVRQSVSSGLNLPSGFIADLYRRHVALILAAALISFGLGYFFIGLAPSYGWVLPAAALAGLGSALWHPAAIGSISLRFPERRGMALSIHGTGASIGDAVAPLAVGALIGAFAWRGVLQWHLLPSVLAAILIWRSVGRVFQADQGPRPSFRSYVRGLGNLLTQRQVLAVMGANAFMGMANITIQTFFPIYIRETLGYSSFVLGVYVALLYLLGAVSQPIMGMLSDRYGRKAVMLPSFFIMGLLYIALVFAPKGIPLALVVAALGLFFYAVANVTTSAVMDVADKRVQSSSMGVMGLFSQPFTLTAPIIAGVIVGHFGIKAAFWYSAATALTATVILIPVPFRRAPGGTGQAH
ncbi:MAG: MFS transporter [Dehalococcoidia bacterium]|nr:MFS transporter [Dehalococcoidia bacterium]